MNLQGKHILLGITGGIAAYKTPALVRALGRAGAEVRVVTTPAAEAFVTPLSLQAVSGHPVRRDLFDAAAEAGMDHIALARWADLVLVAPATADFMARLAAGMADDLLATLCLATAAPIALAPAMNQQMWRALATAHNARVLAARGVHLFGPAEGEQACGESGPGRMLEPGELVERCTDLLAARGTLAGVRVLVTAGPTREAVDPVRFLSNRSSGRMGFAMAEAAAALGAGVTLVSGPVDLPTPAGVERVDVVSAAEMAAAVAARSFDVFIGTAAVADYRPVQSADQKIKKTAERLTLELERNPDILASVAARADRPFTVGFAAETGHLEAHARDKLTRKQLDLIAANDVSAGAQGGFDSPVNALRVFWAGGEVSLPLQDKRRLARQLMDLIVEHYRSRRS
ncbi:MAG: bifunctional phosphopantothenoylcysteine decarboxylase/phosphopantothenate--cysteine ligase CoaBC [Thiohalomonadaceae bacterium]